MARAQQRGGSPFAVWMIVCLVLWLTTLAGLVVLYTMQEDLKNNHDRMRQRLSELVTDQERSSIPLIRNLGEGKTAVGLLEEARAETARLALGDPEADVQTIRSARQALIDTIRADGVYENTRGLTDVALLDGFETIYGAYKKERQLRDAAERRKTELEEQVAQLNSRAEAQRSEFDDTISTLRDQLAEVEKDRDEYRAERDEQVDKLAEQKKQELAAANATRTKEGQLKDKYRKDLEATRERYTELKKRFAHQMVAPAELSTARQPDGQILTAIPGDTVVYINLGAKDGLTLGLQFAVYAPETGIPADGRSKAQVEVVSISESSAECRIVHVSGHEVIVEGDLVANPMYDPDRALSFYVVGEFDMNRDGTLDADGARAMEAMIRAWGGSVASELTGLTDFVIVGAAPPKPLSEDRVQAEDAQRNEAVKRTYDRYVNTVGNAQTTGLAERLSIPVLTQEVLLNFLGYSGRVAQR